VVSNFGSTPIELPEGELLISSQPLEAGLLPGESTAWLRVR
jgi:alpha-glucosidase